MRPSRGEHVKDVARLGRLQTAVLEMLGFAIAGILGGFPVAWIPILVVFGLVAHLAGFGMNSVSDYLAGYDARDPAKADHPLVAGRMSVREARSWVVVWVSLGILMEAAILHVTSSRSVSIWMPALAFAAYLGLGTLYNVSGKGHKAVKVLEISAAYALGFLAVGTAWAGTSTGLVDLVALYIFLYGAYDIAIAGELKDIGQAHEDNLLRRLGADVDPGTLWFSLSRKARIVAAVLASGKILAVAALAYAVGGTFWAGLITLPTLGVLVVYDRQILQPGAYDRPRRLRTMGLGEAVSYLLAVLALAPILGVAGTAIFTVLPVVWFLSVNRWLWPSTGSSWAPGV